MQRERRGEQGKSACTAASERWSPGKTEWPLMHNPGEAEQEKGRKMTVGFSNKIFGKKAANGGKYSKKTKIKSSEKLS